MPPKDVKPDVETNQHDAAEALACCEAVQRPGTRFVAVERAGQQAMAMLHRVRDQLVGQKRAQAAPGAVAHGSQRSTRYAATWSRSRSAP